MNPKAHFVGGLRRPLGSGSVTYSWPLIGLYVFPDHFEFGPALWFLRRISPPIKIFTATDVNTAGPTGRGVRITFSNGERWIFGWCDVRRVLQALAEYGISTTNEIEAAHWTPPL